MIYWIEKNFAILQFYPCGYIFLIIDFFYRILSYNQLECMAPTSFSGLHKLRIL